MGEPFKNLLGAREVHAAASHLARASADGRRGAFAADRFVKQALAGLAELEFKARAEHLADALEAALPGPFAAACDLIEAALAPARDHDADADAPPAASDAGLSGWIVWPLGEFVARRGLAEPERALAALHALTRRFSAEWAIRPFIAAHPELAFRTLAAWTRDPSAHVRRLVSEGSRPRLPWGRQLAALIADPRPTFPLLLALQDDPSPYVRRSVANHLNDVARDHPELVADWLHMHLPGASPERHALLRHASRSLIKAGHPRTLAAFGLGAAFLGTARFTVTPQHITLGDSLALELELSSSASAPQRLVIDYVVHHVKASGASSPKVFKGWSCTLAPRQRLTLSKRHPVRPISTRRYYPGLHRVELQINGSVHAGASFHLQLAP